MKRDQKTAEEWLLSQEPIGTVLRKIYELRKRENPKFSIQYICDRSGIPSKGYLADVMADKRKLKPEYAIDVARACGLEARQARLFELKVLRNKAKGVDEKAKLEKSIKRSEKTLLVRREPYSASPNFEVNPFILAKTFSAFGIVKRPATLRSISRANNETPETTATAVEELVRRGHLIKTTAGYDLTEAPQVSFGGEGALEIVSSYLAQAQKRLPLWFDKRDESYFESCSISVSQKKYRQILQEIRRVFDEYMSELETEDADCVVHFNVQIFPD